MTTAVAHGIRAELPEGFEAHIFRRQSTGRARGYAVAHFASFPLPPGVADFGGGAVTVMRPTDVFAVLFEYGPESVGRNLFAHQGLPRALAASDFRPYRLRRGLAGQAGAQRFFTEAGRPFTFYAVLGSYLRRAGLVPHVNGLLSSITIRGGSPWN